MKKTRRNIGRAYVCPELEVIVFYSALLASSPEVQPEVVEGVDLL